jgi:hypothetical protein
MPDTESNSNQAPSKWYELVWTICVLAGKNGLMKVPPQRRIVAFHQDANGDWVADLECGHTQHVRHNPPWQSRPWVITPEGRSGYLGRELACKKCGEEMSPLRG